MMNILTDEIRNKVFSTLTNILGDATGIYTTIADMNNNGYDEFFSTLKIEDGQPVGYGDPIEETDDVAIFHGASRITFIPYDEEFVIKMPITAVWDWKVTMTHEPTEKDLTAITSEWSSDFNEDYYTEELGYEVIGREFCCHCERTEFDLMDSENALRDEAEEICEAAASILLPNEYVGDYNGIPVWIQRRIKCTQDNAMNWCGLGEEEYNSIARVSPTHVFADPFTYALIQEYGEDEAAAIIETIKQLGIDDLHSGNIGFLSTGEAVCFDYAGYNENDIWVFKTEL